MRYGLAVDDRDYDAIAALFTLDAELRTAAGVCKGQGRDGVVSYFAGHLPMLGPSNHFVHGHVIDPHPSDPDRATGIVSSHAELWRAGRPMITAMRYLDTYRREDGEWRFAERVQTYMYFTDVREYADVLGSDLRIRTGGVPAAADWPRLVS